VAVYPPLSSEVSLGIICFEVADLTPDGVVAKLQDRNVIASVAPPV